jgi:hypothetical protein
VSFIDAPFFFTFCFLLNIFIIFEYINHLKTIKMDKNLQIELLKAKIKDLEWTEDYHQKKLNEAEFQIEIFRKELKSLE